MCLPGVSKDTNEILKPIQPETSINSRLSGEQLANNYKCYFCEKIVEFLFKELDTDKTREYVKKVLDRSCKNLFKKEESQSKCEEYVIKFVNY